MNLYVSSNYRIGIFQFQFIRHTIPITPSFNIKKTTVGIHNNVRREEIKAVFNLVHAPLKCTKNYKKILHYPSSLYSAMTLASILESHIL
jgi:hypothetical protein